MSIEYPPLAAIGSVGIEIFGPSPNSAKWDVAQWDVDVWAAIGWSNVTPESVVCEIAWGADQPQGALTICAAGSWSVKTYDPKRLLDPSNGESPYVASLRPGRPFRVTHTDPVTLVTTVVRQGLIDEVSYNIKEKTGGITGTDNISLMAQASMLPEQNLDPLMPQTLRARARYLLQKAGLDKIIEVESDGSDPTISYPGRVLGGVIAPVPASHWGLGEAADAFIDVVGGWNGHAVGTVTRHSPSLAGTDGSLVGNAGGMTADLAIYPNPGENYTVMAWITWDGSGEHYIIDKIKAHSSGTGYTGYRFQVGGSDGSLRLLQYGPDGVGSNTMSDTGIIQPNVRYHVAATRSPIETCLYINGMLVKVAGPGPYPLGVDNSCFTRTSQNGAVDELSVWFSDGGSVNLGYCLTAEQISAIYTTGEVLLIDPPVAQIAENEASVWTHINDAALDALYACWMDNQNVLRFRSFGDPRDNGFAVGGVDGIPIQNVEVFSGLQGVYTHIIGYDITAPNVPVSAFDATKASIYGDILMRRQHPVPDAWTWVNNLLADRSGAALQYQPGTIYPQTHEQMQEIIRLGMMDIMHVRAESITPTIDVATRVLGGKIIADTETGWTAIISSYIPAKEWEDQETTPPPDPEPPDPTPPPTKEVTRYYDCVKDAVGAKEPGGRNYGAGTDGEIPVGAWMGWKFRAFFDFEDISFSDVVGDVVQAAIEVDTTTQVQVGFGSTPKVVLRRITESWSEGSRDHPSYDNALIYPGPSTTSTNSKTISVPDAENRAVELLITQMVRDWQHGSKQYGVAMFSAGEDNEKYTTEFWARTNGTTSKRPRLRLTVKVPA